MGAVTDRNNIQHADYDLNNYQRYIVRQVRKGKDILTDGLTCNEIQYRVTTPRSKRGINPAVDVQPGDDNYKLSVTSNETVSGFLNTVTHALKWFFGLRHEDQLAHEIKDKAIYNHLHEWKVSKTPHTQAGDTVESQRALTDSTEAAEKLVTLFRQLNKARLDQDPVHFIQNVHWRGGHFAGQ